MRAMQFRIANWNDRRSFSTVKKEGTALSHVCIFHAELASNGHHPKTISVLLKQVSNIDKCSRPVPIAWVGKLRMVRKYLPFDCSLLEWTNQLQQNPKGNSIDLGPTLLQS